MAIAPPSFSFDLSISLNTSKTNLFGPRLGTIFLRRSGNAQVILPTPTFITTTSRGIVPHLSRDNLRRTPAARWVNVPFETFLEHTPPIPTLLPSSSKDKLHSFLGFDPRTQIVSLSARDPDDVQEMPPNGTASLSVSTLRGVRKLTPSDWKSYTLECQPDIVFALCDTPFTDPVNHVYSQKRLTKSIERTATWLGVLLRPWSAIQNENERSKKKKKGTKPKADPNVSSLQTPPNTVSLPRTPNPPLPPLLPIFLPMAGGSSPGARRAFASSLLEPFSGPEAEIMKHRGLETLDGGVVGYSFDLAPLKGTSAVQNGVNRSSLKGAIEVVQTSEIEAEASTSLTPTHPSHSSVDLFSLIQTSLIPLLRTKPRLINSTNGPHEILRYITQVGADIFDAAWAQRLAGWGVGLDFEFPIRTRQSEGGRLIGHNLYDESYAFDFGTVADAFRGGYVASTGSEDDDRPICACAACSPLSPSGLDQLEHGVDSPEHTLIPEQRAPTVQKHHTRAYIHHLLQTHEMGAHALLSMHNLTVLDRFFEGIREVLGKLGGSSRTASAEDGNEDEDDSKMKRWTEEVDCFCQRYDETKSRELFERARRDWGDVDRARGKGRLAREREKLLEEPPN